MSDIQPDEAKSLSMRKPLFAGLAVVLVLAIIAVMARSCSTTPDGFSKNSATEKAKRDPWPEAVNALGKDTDQNAIRRALEQLNLDLSLNTNADAPEALSLEAEKGLKSVLPGLEEEDWKEIRQPSYTRLDGQYLSDCYFFRDIVRSLEVSELPRLKQADIVFAFVCRQMYLSPRFVQSGGSTFVAPPVPPSMALRRGWGSGYERAAVFLSLIHQLGMEGCLLGPSGAVSQSEKPVEVGNEAVAFAPVNRFWAVGVRIGSEIYLFEPYRGTPIPGVNAGETATWKQLKSKTASVNAWRTDPSNPWDVTAEVVDASKVYLVVPLSGIAPRWKLLEVKCTAASAVKAFVDPIATRKAFQDIQPGTDVEYWSPRPERNPFDFTHSLSTFFSVDEGGRDSTKSGPNRQTQYLFSQFPQLTITMPPELKQPGATSRLRELCYNYYFSTILASPTALERIQKGQFFEASTLLTEKERVFAPIVRKYQGGQLLPPLVRKFAAELDEKYARYGIAKIDQRPEAGQLEAEITAAWNAREVGTMIERATAETILAEATYYLAVAKQEAAERTLARAERADETWKAATKDAGSDPVKVAGFRTRLEQARVTAAEAWKAAHGWWETYDAVKGPTNQAFPGRTEHIQSLSNRAARLALGR